MNDQKKEISVRTGTSGLDEMLEFDPAYWAAAYKLKGLTPSKDGKLKAGSSTLLIGPPGTGKSTICLQFLFEGLCENPSRSPLQTTDNVLYIAFHRDDKQVQKSIDQHWNRFIADRQSGEKKHPFERCFQRLVFRQAQIDFNLLAAQITSAIQHDRPTRIAIDGLSAWLTACEPQDSGMLVEALHFMIVDASKRVPRPPTVFLAYETPLNQDPLAPRSVGIPAANIFVLNHVSLDDTHRKLIYVIKTSAQNSDPSVREVVYNDQGLLVIQPGFDAFTGLLRGQPDEASVVLQFFAENEAERQFNRWSKRELKKFRNLDFQRLTFFRSEIGRTLEEMDARSDLPPSALRIYTVDEWWLKSRSSPAHVAERADEKVPKGTANGHPALVELTELWQSTKSQPLLPDWSDFWFVEVEKAMLPVLERNLTHSDAEASSKEHTVERRGVFAVPGYADYAMFCVNYGLLCKLEGNSMPRETDDLENFDWWSLFADLPRVWVSSRKPLQSRRELPHHYAAGDNTLYGRYRDLVRKGQRKFLQHKRTGVEREPFTSKPYLFAFDSSTVETCVCTFLEFSWAFGEPENFLASYAAKNPGELDYQAMPCVDALVFLQLLVLEGLMPAAATVEDTANALFSRHFYSTLTDVRTKNRREKAADTGRPMAEEAGSGQFIAIEPVPFFPVGCDDEKVRTAACNDAETRLLRLWTERIAPGEKHVEVEKKLTPLGRKKNSLVARINNLIRASQAIRDHLDKKECHVKGMLPRSGTGPHADLEDIEELLAWNALRLNLLCSKGLRKLQNKPLADLWRPPTLLKKPRDQKLSFVLSGYGATGSWMYGVDRSSRSISLARDLIHELTSFNAAEKRAELGAGIPVRKDFFRNHGSKRARHTYHLTWTELFRFAGARARRRHRALGNDVNSAPIYKLIYDGLTFCLTRAAVEQRTRSVDRMDHLRQRAEAFVKRVIDEMKEMKTTPTDTHVTTK